MYGILSAIAGVFIYDFLITTPRLGFSFTIGFPVTLIIMLLVVITSSTVTMWIKKQAAHARKQRQIAEMLYSVNRKLLSTRDVDSIARYSMEYLKNELNLSVAFFTNIMPEGVLEFYFRQGGSDVDSNFFPAGSNPIWPGFVRRRKNHWIPMVSAAISR